MGGLFSILQRFGIGRVIAVLGAAAGAVAVLAMVVFHVGGEPESLLYSNLDLKEASQITGALSQANIKYDSKGDGSVIMVPRDKVGTARLLLASKGLPTSGSVGYEIFDNTSALGQTDFVQQLNRQRALEGELARTITSLRGVTSARVHLVLPKRELFEEEAAPPTASIVVGVGSGQLSGEEVQSLRNLVAGAVPNLKPEKVTVVDETGRMLAAGSEDGDDFTSSLASDRKNDAEERLRKAIKDVVEGVVGVGKARVQVTADLDLNRVTTQEEKYDPDGQVVLSTSTGGEKSQDNSSNSSTGATASANIPGQGAAGGGGSTSQGNTSDKNEETTNYVISKTTRTEVTEPGAVKRLSVAVAVDGVATTAKSGKVTYTPRSAEEMQHIQDLVRSAMGFDQARGDQVSVVNVRFSRDAEAVGGTEAKAGMFNFDKNDIMRGVELLIALVVGVLIIFFVLRPIMKSAGGALPQLAGGGAMGGGGGGMAMGAQTQQLAYAGDGGGGQLALAAPDSGIDISRVEGQVKVSSIKKVADFVNKHPEESISILRNWLHEN
ncbi:MAG TPA: flagellar basal-body MS-ring/collar protein FliF [Caulobacteraceae bacterium]